MRLPRIDELDLNLFEFDYDLTFMVFFLSAEGKVYARYGGRDAADADSRHSLEGLKHTMASVLEMHGREEKAFAPRSDPEPRYIRDVQGGGWRFGRCFHCHQVQQILNRDLQQKGTWRRDLVWRFPSPENLGFELEVDRGNVVKKVKEESPAAAAGLKAGDLLTRLNSVPTHSFGDAQLALDRAPSSGRIEMAWQRGNQNLTGHLSLPEGWRKTDISWRTSTRHYVPTARLGGTDLTPEEKMALGLSAKQLAFRQQDSLSSQARAAGIRPGDIVLGIDDQHLDTDVFGFLSYVQRNYLVGDKATIHLLRDGKKMALEMTFAR